MNPTEKLTDLEERPVAREIAKLLRQKGASYDQCERILEQANKMLREIPLTGCQD